MKNKWRNIISLSLALCVLAGSAMPITAAETEKATQVSADEDFVLDQAYKLYSEKYENYEFGEEKALTVKDIVAKSRNTEISKSV